MCSSNSTNLCRKGKFCKTLMYVSRKKNNNNKPHIHDYKICIKEVYFKLR